MLNTAYNGLLSATQTYNPTRAPMFWDGRMQSLEAQALGPLQSYNEMRGDAYKVEHTFDSLCARLNANAEYVSLFKSAFGQDALATKENIGKAIANYERTFVAKNSPYDRYVKGDKSALSDAQMRGLLLFYGKAECNLCHLGPMFSDYQFYVLGIDENPVAPSQNFSLPYRTPTLRNIALTGPYMHNGVYKTLGQVVEHYNQGVSKVKDVEISDKMRPLNLSQTEQADLIAFMESLTDTDYDHSIPAKVPSGYKPGGL